MNARSFQFDLTSSEIISKCGLDAYLFLRYLHILLRIFISLTMILLPILLPVNLYKGWGELEGVNGLDRLSWVNISSNHTDRYWAHLCVSLFVVVWVCYVCWYELRSYTIIRQRRLISCDFKHDLSHATVIVTDIPESLLTLNSLKRIYDVYPGGVKSVIINRDYSRLVKKVLKRNEIAFKLEQAETKLI